MYLLTTSFKAVNSALSNARFGHYIDGVYNVLATDGSNQFAIVTIEEQYHHRHLC
jgi:hypothetical protein